MTVAMTVPLDRHTVTNSDSDVAVRRPLLRSDTRPYVSLNLFFKFIIWVTGELFTLPEVMKVPNEPGVSPNNGLENAS